MKNFFKKVSAGFFTAAVGLSSAAAAPFVKPEDCINGTTCSTGFRETIVSYINYFLGFLGLLAVIMIIYAGILLVTAQGEEEQIGKGKKIITWAAIGLIVIMLSFVIVRFIAGAGDAVTG